MTPPNVLVSIHVVLVCGLLDTRVERRYFIVNIYSWKKHSPFSCAGCSGPLHLLRIQPPTTTMLLRTRGIPHSLHHHTWLCDVCLRILPMCTQTAVLILHTKYATLGEPKIDVRVLILGGMVHEEQTDKVSRLVSMSGDFKLGIDSLVPLARTRYSAVQGCGRL